MSDRGFSPILPAIAGAGLGVVAWMVGASQSAAIIAGFIVFVLFLIFDQLHRIADFLRQIRDRGQ